MQLGALIFGNATALEGLNATEKHRHSSVQHTCSRRAAWDAHMYRLADAASRAGLHREGRLRVLGAADGTHRTRARRRTVGTKE